MNPPFSAAAHVEGRVADAALRHICSALARLAEGGRLVAITGANLSPDNPAWREAFMRLQERGRIVFSAAIDGRVYARHGTTTDTRLTVIDRVPADDPAAFPASPGMAPDAATLLDWVIRHVPARPPVATSPLTHAAATPTRPGEAAACGCARRVGAAGARQPRRSGSRRRSSPMRSATGRRPRRRAIISEALYEGYALQSIRIPGRAAASDAARAIGRDGVGRAAEAELSAASAARRRLRRACCPTPSSKA